MQPYAQLEQDPREGEGLNDKWPQETLYRNALAETETQI